MSESPAASLVILAETEGFEPSEPFTARLVSSEVLSTTQPRLRIGIPYHLGRHAPMG